MTVGEDGFPVVENADNLIKYAVGNKVVIPDGTHLLYRHAVVKKLVMGKPGGTMLVIVEPFRG